MLSSGLKLLSSTLVSSMRSLKLTGPYPACSLGSGTLANNNLIKTATRSISISSILYAEPLKKKKRLDPAIIRAREQRKGRKLEKAIRRLLKHARQYKPLDELQVPVSLLDHPKQRERRLPPLSSEEIESRWMLDREVSKFRFEQYSREIRFFEQLQKSQSKALTELQKESQALYDAAISIDESLLPYTAVGPVETPPLKDYVSPEGDYYDISKKWDP